MKKTPLLSVIALSSLFLSISIAFGTGPNTPPPNGGYTGGLFSVYFKNIIEGAGSSPLGKCPSGYGIVGYSSTNDASYGTPLCEQITSASSSSYWYPNGANIYYTGGNVGIGTTTPSAKLEVIGQVKITGGSPGLNKILTSDATGLASWTTPSSCTPAGAGTNNICLGTAALGINTSGGNNTAVGVSAMANNTTGSNNVANGVQALQSNTTGNGNIAIGYRTLFSNTSGTYNIGIGENSLYTNTTGVYNVGVGYFSLYGNTTGVNNTAVGFYSLRSNTSGQSNVGIGYTSLYSNTTGLHGTAIGSSALYSNTSGMYNTAVGGLAMYYNNAGGYNTAIGAQALHNNTTGSNNVGIGYRALHTNVSGQSNTAVGNDSLRNNSTGNQNTAYGLGALTSNTSGVDNTANGVYSLRLNTTGNYNTAMGLNSLWANSSGQSNTALGYTALQNNTTGSQNIGIGFGAGSNLTSGTGNIFIGASAQPNVSNTASNQLNIGNWIYGNAGNIGIGVANPGYKLDVGGVMKSNGVQSDGQITRFGVANAWADVNANTYMANTSIYSYGRICVGNASGDCTGAGGAVLGDNSNANLSLGTDGNIRMRNASPTIYLRDTDNRSAMIHNNSNILYFLRGCGNDSDNWCTNGSYWPMMINLENNDVTMGNDLTIARNAYAQGYYYLSDKNLKKDIKPLGGTLEKLTKLNGYSFNWKSSGKKDLGVIAQEVEKVFPELVGERKNAAGDTSKTVQYGNLVAPIIEAIKELATQQKAHNKEIEELKEQNENLQKRLEVLEKKMQ